MGVWAKWAKWANGTDTGRLAQTPGPLPPECSLTKRCACAQHTESAASTHADIDQGSSGWPVAAGHRVGAER